jgi:hypothetical protein
MDNIKIFFLGGKFFFFFGFSFAWLIGPGIFRGNCPLGNFKGRYAGRIGRQNWKSLFFFLRDWESTPPRVFPKCEPQTGSSLFLEGKGYFFTTGEKFLILPAYLPLTFPNGQFPLKIPGPISQAKLKPKKKNKLPLQKKFKWLWKCKLNAKKVLRKTRRSEEHP